MSKITEDLVLDLYNNYFKAAFKATMKGYTIDFYFRYFKASYDERQDLQQEWFIAIDKCKPGAEKYLDSINHDWTDTERTKNLLYYQASLYFVGCLRKGSFKENGYGMSLNTPLDKNEGETKQDLLEDPSADFTEAVTNSVAVDKILESMSPKERKAWHTYLWHAGAYNNKDTATRSRGINRVKAKLSKENLL